MPRESTRQFVLTESAPARLESLQIQVSQSERTVRVALSGILDREGVDKLSSRVQSRLVCRGCRIILDGSRLTHLDFRATQGLIAWNRRMKAYSHQIYLRDWSDYLKAILVMDDWDGEFGSAGTGLSTWRLLGGTTAIYRP